MTLPRSPSMSLTFLLCKMGQQQYQFLRSHENGTAKACNKFRESAWHIIRAPLIILETITEDEPQQGETMPSLSVKQVCKQQAGAEAQAYPTSRVCSDPSAVP